jgi:hypothetical protein
MSPVARRRRRQPRYRDPSDTYDPLLYALVMRGALDERIKQTARLLTEPAEKVLTPAEIERIQDVFVAFGLSVVLAIGLLVGWHG